MRHNLGPASVPLRSRPVFPTLGLLALVMSVTPAIAVRAQDASDAAARNARLHLGPLAVNPSIALSNFGVDTNVFNEFNNGKRDFTATLSSQGQFWLRLGKGRLSGNTRVDYVYFGQYTAERAVNTYDTFRAELRVNRITPYASDTFLNARERPGYEIDARSRRLENTVTLGADARVGPKTTLGFAAWRTNVKFNADEVFAGSYLSQVLNRTADGLRASARHKLTPYTTVVLLAEAQRDRFRFSSVRDSDSVRVMSGFEFDAFALISGTASAGYRKHDALTPGAPSFRGVVGSLDLGYTFLTSTRFSIRAERDIAYSFEIQEPYYLLTGVAGTVTRRVSAKWDLQATSGRQRLAYQGIELGKALGDGRPDRVNTFGGGVGYRFPSGLRLGLNINHFRRQSDRDFRDYDGFRAGISVTYGV
jgi:hypothetical protein